MHPLVPLPAPARAWRCWMQRARGVERRGHRAGHGTATICVDDLPPGVYLLRGVAPQGAVWAERVEVY